VKQQKQFAITVQPPLRLSSNETVLVCISSIEVDIFPLLLESGLVEVLDQLGLQVQVKRSAAGARISICVDSNICPSRHSYSIQVRSDVTVIVAADSTGLLYALYTFMQILQLHSELQTSPVVSDGTPQADVITTVLVPAVDINDWPTVSHRAILWSHRKHCRLTHLRVQEQLELLSKLRINTVLMIVDNVVTPPSDGVDHNGTLAGQDELATDVCAVDEMARKRCIGLIPTHIISSIHHRLSMDLLKNFSQSMTCILVVLTCESVKEELGEATEDAAEQACRAVCDGVFREAQACGFSTILLACSGWVKQMANPRVLAMNAGLNVVEQELGLLLPESLCVKPLLSPQVYVQALHSYSQRVGQNGSFLSVLPAYLDCDFMCPAILTKFYSFIYAGYCWHPAVCADMLGAPADGLFDVKVVQQALLLVLHSPPPTLLTPPLTPPTPLPATSQQLQQHMLNAMLSTLSGEALLSELLFVPVNKDKDGHIHSNVGEELLTLTDVNEAEKLLWAMISNSAVCESEDVVPSRDQAALCLKIFRRLLQVAQWKPASVEKPPEATKQKATGTNSTANGIRWTGGRGAEHRISPTALVGEELSEFFATVNILSVVCKAVIQAHNGHQKLLTTRPKSSTGSVPVLTFTNLMDSLSVGTKSDLANNLLESLAVCTRTWQGRLGLGLHTHFHVMGASVFFQNNTKPLESTSISAEKVSPWKSFVKSDHLSVSRSIRVAVLRFMLQASPQIPASAIFKALTEKLLPLPDSVEDFISRLFKQ